VTLVTGELSQTTGRIIDPKEKGTGLVRVSVDWLGPNGRPNEPGGGADLRKT